jgi:hypothetical protein
MQRLGSPVTIQEQSFRACCTEVFLEVGLISKSAQMRHFRGVEEVE